MRGSEEFHCSDESDDWIYIGGDIYNRIWAKVGKTTNGLNTRHTSSQNPGYFIYAAFNIIRGDVHEIESKLLKDLEHQGYERISHFSTGNKSECFWLNPDEMEGLVEDFIERNYGSCVTYENSLHGYMSRYQCRDDIRRFYDDEVNQSFSNIPQSNALNCSSYFTGNREVYEIDLGNGYYLDLSSSVIKHVDDDEC
ncbi:GIY-YIG nuclease family protein [Vibrio parahaemolyticus]|nr:hypothetical protein [Vibrio parahaemolyticus]